MPSKHTGLEALDLAIELRGRPPACRPTEMMLPGLVVDAEALTSDEAFSAEGASSQKSFYATHADGTRFRLKYNEDRPGITVHEIIAANLLNAIGFTQAPKTALVSDAGGKFGSPDMVRIASPKLPGFKDLGLFLVGLGGIGDKAKEAKGIDYVAADDVAAYKAHLRTYHKTLRTIEKRKADDPALAALCRKGHYDKLTPAQHALLQPLRDLHRKALQEQEKMFDLLPDAFRHELLLAFYTAEIVASWDFFNHDRANSGYAFDGNAISGHTVDHGNSGPNGFNGRRKADSLASANLPARTDDPYAKKDGSYPQNRLQAADTDLTRISPSFANMGLPRSPVMAFLLKPTILAERSRETPGAAVFPLPNEALEVAWRLQQLPRHYVQGVVAAIYAQGRSHADPAVRRLFDPGTTGYAGPEALADDYQQRIDALVARAEAGGRLARWADRHRERAVRVEHEMRHFLQGPPERQDRPLEHGTVQRKLRTLDASHLSQTTMQGRAWHHMRAFFQRLQSKRKLPTWSARPAVRAGAGTASRSTPQSSGARPRVILPPATQPAEPGA